MKRFPILMRPGEHTPPSLHRWFFLFLFVAVPLCTQAQHYGAQNWYFGNSAHGIRFARPTNTPYLIDNKANLGTGASAVASDPTNGNLMFYTDGVNVYDRNHGVMPNGTGLQGNPAGNQSVAVAKKPGSASEYYIFTIDPIGSLAYTVVNMAEFGNATFPAPASGDVVPATKNTALATNRTEAMVIIPHPNRRDFWVVTKENGSTNYTTFFFDDSGDPPTARHFTLGLINVAANFAYHEPSGHIAVSPAEANRNVEVLHFDTTDGELKYSLRVPNSAVNTTNRQAIYDAEWSDSGRYLYISVFGDTGVPANVLQFDMQNPNNSLASVLPQPNTLFRSFGLQMAPDKAIYHLYQEVTGGPYRIGTINNTDTAAIAVTYNASPFAANPDFNGTQFATFAAKDTIDINLDFTSAGDCANTPISFYPTMDPTADSLLWIFGDGDSVTHWSPVHTFEQAGPFEVELYAFLNGDTAYVSHTVNLQQFDLQLSLVQDTTACACELPVNQNLCEGGTIPSFEVTVQAQGGTPQYQWFGPGGLLPGQTTETLSADSAGYYYVTATLGGCSVIAGVNIKEYDSLDQRANIWYFGQNAGIDFNPLPENPAVPIDGPVNSPEGVSVVSDRNGQVIFSTDGEHIYNKLGEDITPPGGIGGDPGSTQSALIIPVPGDETLYYIFTTQQMEDGTYELRYSLFDLKLNNGLGGLAEYNVLLFKPSTERITGDDNWLIAHEYGNNTFRAYRITSEGISNPVISTIGSDHSTANPESGQGYMKLGAQNRLVVALSTPGESNVVEVFDFIDSTGVVTNFRTADLNNAAGQVYGVEVSPAGNKLYATLGSSIYEFAFDSLGNPYFKQSVDQSGELGAIQIGPDGQIYVAINGSPTLGTFSAAEDTAQLTNLNLQPFDLAGNTSTLGLPNFIQSISNPSTSPTFNFTGLCLGDSTVFTASGKDPAIDKFDWVFGDGQSVFDGGPEVSHLYDTADTFTGMLTIRNKCETPVEEFPFQLTINNPPPNPSDNRLVICSDEGLELDANPTDVPDLTYVWSTGDSTETITITQPGRYTVIVRDTLGCTTEGLFMPPDNRPQVDLGPDQTICQDTGVAPLDALNPGALYAWFLNEAPSGTSQRQTVNTADPGVFAYRVVVTDTITDCVARDSVTFTINESPDFTVTNNSPIACNSETGEITITFNAPASSLFTYDVTGPTRLDGTDQPTGSTVTTPNTLATGTYTVTVTDQVTSCPSIQTTGLDGDAFTVTAAPLNECDPRIDVTVQATSGTLTGTMTYRVINHTTGEEVGDDTVPAGDPNNFSFQTAASIILDDGGQYVVEVQMEDGCIATSQPVTIDRPATPQITAVNVDGCSNPISLEVVGGEAWLWTGPGTIATPTNATTTVADLPQGPHEFNLTVTQAGLCDMDTTITVNVNNDVIPDFTASDECADEVTLTATPAGPYTYRWYRNDILVPGGQTLAARLEDNGASYRVEVYNTATGCTFPSKTKTVNVLGALDLTLAATPPCEGQPFTLTATANQTNATFQWALDGEVLAGETAATLEETRGGRYDVTASVGSCSITRNFNVTPLPVTEGSLPGSGIICPDPANPDPLTREVTLDAGPDFVSYNWLRDGMALNENSQTYTAFEPGLYSVELVNIYGCPTTDETLLIEDCTPRITGPNAFRPSSTVEAYGEFANQNFRLFTFFIADEDFEVFIFNRWGEMVYHTTDREFRWNGGYNNNPGQPLPPGTYTYVVRYKSVYRPDEGIQEKRGGVVLLR